MGAYYDILVAPGWNYDSTVRVIGEFLATRKLSVTNAIDLRCVEINDHNAILFSPPANGWLEIVAGAGIEIDATWYASNPLATYLSNRLRHCIHLWSLNSGRVVGYAVYENGKNAECECLFSRSVANTREMFDGVPTPSIRRGRLLQDMLGVQEPFRTFVGRFENLERGMGEFVGRIGFPVHLVDYYDATDDFQGIEIKDGRYESIELTGWSAILFDAAGKKSLSNG